MRYPAHASFDLSSGSQTGTFAICLPCVLPLVFDALRLTATNHAPTRSSIVPAPLPLLISSSVIILPDLKAQSTLTSSLVDSGTYLGIGTAADTGISLCCRGCYLARCLSQVLPSQDDFLPSQGTSRRCLVQDCVGSSIGSK